LKGRPTLDRVRIVLPHGITFFFLYGRPTRTCFATVGGIPTTWGAAPVREPLASTTGRDGDPPAIEGGGGAAVLLVASFRDGGSSGRGRGYRQAGTT